MVTSVKHPAKYTDTLIPIFADLLRDCPNVLDPMAGTGKIGQIKKHGYKGYVDRWINIAINDLKQMLKTLTEGDERNE